MTMRRGVALARAGTDVARGGARRSDGAFAGHADQMGRPTAQVSVAAELRLFLKPAHRSGPVRVGCDGISSLGPR